MRIRIHADRRGSALLIVIGTLALIAVFAAIYITIGQGDRRAAATVRTRNDAKNIENTLADYIAGVVADDRVDVYTQHQDPGTAVLHTREVTDAPYTDWTVRSGSNNDFELFNPTGRHTANGLSANLDFRVPYDGWLASTRPSFIGDDVFGRTFSLGFADPATKEYLDHRDWYQITNLAPDGRFVNLHNLRPQMIGGVSGGFEAEPGIGVTNFPSGRRVRRLSNELTLIRPQNQFNPQTRLQAHTDGYWLPGQIAPVGALDPNIPAHWTMHQRFMFMPIDQPFEFLDRSGALADWSSPDYPPYQYADTTGDGMADARWFELTSAQEFHGLSGTPRDDIKRLYDSREFRVFAAARVVDLSSMVNVNTATDGLGVPTGDTPMGSSPAEVDLRRLLTMQDAGQEYLTSSLQSPFADIPVSLAGIHRVMRYQQTGGAQYNKPESDYLQYRTELLPSAGPLTKQLDPDSDGLLIGRFAYDALRIGLNREFGLQPQFYPGVGSLEYFGQDYSVVPAPTQYFKEDLLQYPRDPLFTAYPGKPTMISADTREEMYQKIGRLDPANQGTGGHQEYGSGLYGLDDMAELLTFHGINDPSVTSRLETAVSGRLSTSNGLEQNRLSPMMSNRPLSMDRFNHGSVKDGAVGNNPNRPRLVNGMIAEESMTMFAVSPRSLMTTFSGSVGLRPSTPVTMYANGTRPGELTLNEVQSTFGAATSNPITMFGIYRRALAGELGSVYSTGGIGDSVWVMDPSLRRTDATAAPYATLFYGHRGPEYATRLAAHATANMVDMNDNDDQPTVATVLINSPTGNARRQLDDLRDEINAGTLDITSNNDAMLFPGEVQSFRFEVPEDQVSPNFDTDALTARRRAFNVYGVEPMPVISEVSSMYVYTDAPEAAGGDKDYTEPFGLFVPLATKSVTIRGGIDPLNEDFLLQILAVQLTNPFDEPINLGGVGGNDFMKRKGNTAFGNTNNFEFLYYFEYNGRYFKLGEFVEFNPSIADGGTDYSSEGGPPPNSVINPAVHDQWAYRDVTLQPNESRVFYAIAQERFDNGVIGTGGVDQRWRDILNAYSTLPLFHAPGGPDNDLDGIIDGPDGADWTGLAEEWVQNMFLNEGGGRAAHVHQFNPTSGALTEVNVFSDLFAPALAGSVGGVTRTAEPLQVRLWRKFAMPDEEAEFPVPANGTGRNFIQNDILVDRFYLSSPLDNPLRTASEKINDTVSFGENLNGGGPNLNRNDNKGLSLVRWKTQRRLDTVGNEMRLRGQVGPWMIQSRRNPSTTRTSYSDTDEIPSMVDPDANTFFTVTGSGSIDRTDTNVTPNGDLEIQPSLRDLYDLRRGARTNKIIQTIAVHPGLKSEVAGGVSGLSEIADAANKTAAKFDVAHLSPNLSGDTLYGTGVNDPQPEMFNKHGWSAKRIADLLLTTGVGITYAPDLARNRTDQSVNDEDWITFPEALAIALGYENPGATDISADSVFVDSVLTAGPGGQREYALDDTHLSIDNYVAYIDLGMNQVYDPGVDIRRGTGVPMALSVIDSTRPIGFLARVGDTALSASEQAQLALSRPTMGTININTAPLEVLRLLPGLTPSVQQYRDEAMMVDEWWGKDPMLSSLNLPDLLTAAQTPDIASGLVAYRDRTATNPRSRSNDATMAALSYQPLDRISDSGTNMIDEITGGPTTSREAIAGINGLRGAPGFGSLGELLAVTIEPGALGGGIEPHHLTAGYYGHDIIEQGVRAIDTDGDLSSDDFASIDLQVFGTKTSPVSGDVVDDYAERLAVANSVLNSVSVRSDYFAVWFVIQGFRESDVANLGENDPLVPSFKKRYIMVVDRSNVVKEGQKPEILLLREVPL